MDQMKRIKQNLQILSSSARSAKRDLKDKRLELHNIDFALIYGYLFSRPDLDIWKLPDQDSDVNALGRNLISLYRTTKEIAPFRVLISIPTMFEFASHALRVSDAIGSSAVLARRHVRIYDEIARRAEERTKQGLMTGDRMETEFEKAVKSIWNILPTVASTTNWHDVKLLLCDSFFSGFGDFYSREDYEAVKDIIQSERILLESELQKHRHRRENETPESFLFRNKIDAINLAISHAFNTRRTAGYRASFVGPYPRSGMSANAKQIIRDAQENPANVVVKLAAISRFRSPPGSTYDREIQWLDDLEQDAEVWLGRLERAVRFEDIGRDRADRLGTFWHKQMMPALFPTDTLLHSQPNPQGSSIDEVLSDSHKAFVGAFERARSKVDEAGRAVFQIQPVIQSEELLADFEMNDETSVKKVIDRFGR